MSIPTPQLSEPENAYHFLYYTLPRILTDEPKRLAMRTYLLRENDGRNEIQNIIRQCGITTFPACGTVGCIAGWTVELTRQQLSGSDENLIFERARDLLGLSNRQARFLFLDDELCGAKNQGTPEHVAAVTKHIRKFANLFEEQLKATIIHPPIQEDRR